MTLQDDLARHWFQPMVPMDQAQTDQTRPDTGPLTTRIVGELVPPHEPRTPPHPEPEQLEVTQPYLPAIRDEAPEFAKRLNPEHAPSRERLAPAPAPAVNAVPAPARQEPPESLPSTEPPATPRQGAQSGPPSRRRSLARRLVRRIIGPDLLRKDPVSKRR